MTTVRIYHTGIEIDSVTFQGSFLIVRHNDGTRSWRVDGEPVLREGGEIELWLLESANPPSIQFLPPGWQLIVDDEMCFARDETKLDRFTVPIKGSIAELKYDDLSFVFYFAQGKDGRKD